MDTFYKPEWSNVEKDHYSFGYEVNIKNVGDKTAELRIRKW